uniref:Odorant receptor n=1 Tax=Diabrotica virgifera virgifera TaxID=50390 RepID=A0A6P7GB65_DIAVI
MNYLIGCRDRTTAFSAKEGASARHLLTTYGTIMRNYEKLLKAMQEIEKLHNTFTRPPSESLLKNITISSLRFRKFSAIFTVITFLQSMSTFMLFEDRATSFPYILIKNIFGDNIIIKIALCSVILPHSWCFGSMPMLLSNYYTWHFEYSLKMLKEQMEMCTINKTGHVHTLDPLDCSICQRMIENELKYFLKQYTRINSAIVFYIDIVKWRFLAIACAGAYFMATTSFYIMSLRSKAAFPYLGLLLISTLVAFVFSEGGEKIEEECRQIHIAAQQFKWYYWNKSNRQLLLMFLTMTEHPMSVTCYGFATQNRTLLLKVSKRNHVSNGRGAQAGIFAVTRARQIITWGKNLYRLNVPLHIRS